MPALLESPYLVSAYTDPKTGKNKTGSVKIWPNRYFAVRSKSEFYFMHSDENGRICSIESNLKYLPATGWLKGQIKEIILIEEGLFRNVFASSPKNWQKVLMDEITKSKIPVLVCETKAFAKADILKPSLENKEDLRVLDCFKDGVSFLGLRIARVQTAKLGVSKSLVKPGMESVTAKCGSTTFKFLKTNSDGTDGGGAGYFLFQVISVMGTLPKGTYHFSIANTDLNHNGLFPGHPATTIGLDFSVEFGFGHEAPETDFDLKNIHPYTLEKSLLDAFPESFGLLMHDLEESPKSSPPSAEASARKKSLQSAIDTAKSLNAAQKSVVGYVNGLSESNIRKSVSENVWKLVKKTQIDDSTSKDLVAAIESTIASLSEAKETAEKFRGIFKKFAITESKMGSLKVIENAIDGNLITKYYRKTKWQRWLIDELSETNLGNRKDTGKSLALKLAKADVTPAQARLLMADGIPKSAKNMDHLLGGSAKFVGKGLMALDTAVSLANFVGLLSEIQDIGQNHEAELRKLSAMVKTYSDKFGHSFSPDALALIEAVRKTADTLGSDMSKKEQEALLQAVWTAVGVVAMVPVVGEFAALFLVAKAGYETVETLLGGIGRQIDHQFLSYTFEFWNAQHARLKALTEAHTTNSKELRSLTRGKGSEEMAKDILVQYRIRLAAIIGLIRLVERLGSRFKDSAAFEKKIKDYRIQEYVTTFIQNRTLIPNYFEIPLDEFWLYTSCNSNQDWNHVYSKKKFGKTFLPVEFQKYWPIHSMESGSISQFAKVFSRNYAKAIYQDKVQAEISLRNQAEDAWVKLSDWQGAITPLTQVKVKLAVSSVHDLSGLPVSLQLIRNDMLLNYEGPKYKGMFAVEDSAGYHAGKENRFAAIFTLFYFWRNEIKLGIKPFMHIGLSANPGFSVKFSAKIGDAEHSVDIPNRSSNTIAVSMPLRETIFCEMLRHRDFLENKGTDNRYQPLFIYEDPEVIGVWYKSGNRFIPFAGKSRNDFDGDLRSNFRWNESFEILILIQAPFTTVWWADKPDIRFPVFISTTETMLLNSVGPSYPAECVCLVKPNYEGRLHPNLAGIQDLMYKREVLQSSETLAGGNVLHEVGKGLFAIRMAFQYGVEAGKGEFKTYFGFKPFGDDYPTQSNMGHFEFEFGVESPEPIGLKIPSFLNTKFGPILPADIASRPFLGKPKFITDPVCHPLKDIHQAVFQ